VKTIIALIVAAIASISAIATPIQTDTTEIRIVSKDQNQLRFSITGEGTDQIDEPGLRIVAYKTSVVVVWDPVGPHSVYDGFATKTGVMNYLVGFEGQDWSYTDGTWNFAYWAPFFTPSLDTDPPRRLSTVPESGSSALLLLIGIAALAMGCTKTKIDRRADGSWSINRSSLFQKLEELAGALCALIGVVWSIWEKRQNRRSGSGARLQDTPPPPPPTAGAVAAMILCGLALMLTTSGCSSMRGLATARIEIVSGTNRLLVVQPKDTVFKKLEFNPTTGAIEVTGYASAANAAAVAAQQAQTESIAASINQGIGQASTLAQQMMQVFGNQKHK
jgi:hypothetical protein